MAPRFFSDFIGKFPVAPLIELDQPAVILIDLILDLFK